MNRTLNLCCAGAMILLAASVMVDLILGVRRLEWYEQIVLILCLLAGGRYYYEQAMAPALEDEDYPPILVVLQRDEHSAGRYGTQQWLLRNGYSWVAGSNGQWVRRRGTQLIG